MVDLRVGTQEFSDRFGQLKNRYGRPGSHIEYAVQVSVLRHPEVGRGNVAHVDEVAGLESVSKDADGFVTQSFVYEYGNSGRVLRGRILVRSKDIEIS